MNDADSAAGAGGLAMLFAFFAELANLPVLIVFLLTYMLCLDWVLVCSTLMAPTSGTRELSDLCKACLYFVCLGYTFGHGAASIVKKTASDVHKVYCDSPKKKKKLKLKHEDNDDKSD